MEAWKIKFIRSKIIDIVEDMNKSPDFDFVTIMREFDFEERVLRLALEGGDPELYFKITLQGFVLLEKPVKPTIGITYTERLFLKIASGNNRIAGQEATPDQILRKAYLTGDITVEGLHQFRDIGILTEFHRKMIANFKKE